MPGLFGFIACSRSAGLSGIFLAASPSTGMTDTYYVVAHMH